MKQALAARVRAVSNAAVAVRAGRVAAETVGVVESKHPPLPLAAANAALRARDFPRAATLYLRALRAYPGLTGVVAANLLVMRRLHRRAQCGDLEGGAAVVDRRHEAAQGALERELQALCRKWASLSLEPKNDRHTAALAQAFEDAAGLVAAHPRASVAIGERGVLAEIVAVLYRKLWGASVVGTAPPPTGAARVAWQRHLPNGLQDSLAQVLLDLPDVGDSASCAPDAQTRPKAEEPSATPAALPRKAVAAAAPAPAHPASPAPALPAAAQATLPAAVTARPFSRPAPPRKPPVPWLAQSELQRLGAPEASTALRLGGFTLARAVAAPQERGGTLHNTFAAFARLCRLPFADSAALPSVEPRPGECALLGLDVPGLATLSLDFTSDRRLLLRLDASALPADVSIVVRGYQRELDGDSLVLVGEAMLANELLALVEFALTDACSPVLFTATTPDAQLLAAALAPFPSLSPGGVHGAEAFAAGALSMASLRCLSRQLLVESLSPVAGQLELGVAIAGATGAEPVFSRDFRDWLDLIFGVRLVAWGGGGGEALGLQSATSPPALVLPAEAIPSLHALVAARLTGRWPHDGSYLLAEKETALGRWRIEVREPQGLLDRLSVGGTLRRPLPMAPAADTNHRRPMSSPAPLALVFREDAAPPPISLLAPVAPGAEVLPEFAGMLPQRLDVRVVAVCASAEHGAALAEALALQEGAEISALTLLAPQHDHAALRASLPRALAQRTRIQVGTVADAASELATCEGLLLILGRPVLPHDTRTLAALSALALVEGVAASTCLLLATEAQGSTTTLRALGAGYAVRHVADGSALLSPVAASSEFPLDVFPVVATGPAVCMTTTQRWRSEGPALLGAQSDSGVRLATSRFSARLLEQALPSLEGPVPAAPALALSVLPA